MGRNENNSKFLQEALALTGRRTPKCRKIYENKGPNRPRRPAPTSSRRPASKKNGNNSTRLPMTATALKNAFELRMQSMYSPPSYRTSNKALMNNNEFRNLIKRYYP